MATGRKFKVTNGLDNNSNEIVNIGISGGNITRAGAHLLTLTTGAATNATFPNPVTGGALTIVTLDNTQTLSNKTLASAKLTGPLTVGTTPSTGTSGQVLTSGGSGGELSWTTVSSGGGGTVTNTGGNLTSNSVVLGAGTNDVKVVAGITTNGTAQLSLGVASTTLGSVKMFGNTSGDVTIQPTAAAGTATVQTLPATTGTLVNRVTTANGVSASNTDGALSFTLGAITPSTVNGLTLSTTAITTTNSTMAVFNTTSTTVNAFGAATSLSIGNTATAAQTVNMFTASTGASTYNFATGATANATTKTINIGTAGVSGSTTNINIGSAVSGASGTTTVSNNLVVSGNLTVNGTTTTLNSTTLTVDDINIVLGDTASPTDTTANGGGITLKGTTDKTITYNNAQDSWNSNIDFNVSATAGGYFVGNSPVLNQTTLGSTVVNSSLTSVGTITTGTWNATTIATNKGGTGLTTFTAANNAIYSTSASALTAGTLPVAAGGTGLSGLGSSLQVLAVNNAGTAAEWAAVTGTGNVVRATSPTLTTPSLGVATATSIGYGGIAQTQVAGDTTSSTTLKTVTLVTGVPTTTGTAVELLIASDNGTTSCVTKLLGAVFGSTISIVEYGAVASGGGAAHASYDVTLSGTTLQLGITAASSTTTNYVIFITYLNGDTVS